LVQELENDDIYHWTETIQKMTNNDVLRWNYIKKKYKGR